MVRLECDVCECVSINEQILSFSGIGRVIALDLAQRGARVILACRSAARGSAVLKEIREKTGNPDVHLRLVDLSSLDSVREFAKGILEEEKALHILVNNAGASGDQWNKNHSYEADSGWFASKFHVVKEEVCLHSDFFFWINFDLIFLKIDESNNWLII